MNNFGWDTHTRLEIGKYQILRVILSVVDRSIVAKMRLTAGCFDRLLANAVLAHRNLRFCLFQRRCYVNTYATQPLQASCSALH